ncbi:hypothetical protein TruAng_012279 [Truncatella angustata]|nr:hypothetical protein TruAng_012279 [Truncatella angustata]
MTSQYGVGTCLEPTWKGYCGGTLDALYLIEWCIRGNGKHVTRRPHDRERASLIASGNIFIYQEQANGIKRWTDGILWSPSRMLGNFFIYRELDKPFKPRQKRKTNHKENGATKASSNHRPTSIRHAGVKAIGSATGPSTSGSFSSQGGPSLGNSETRALVGSLVDRYDFKKDGLIKKTISLSYNDTTHHIVSYYTIEDVKSNILHRPSETFLRDYLPRPELIQSSNFRVAVGYGDIFFMPDNPRYGGYSAPQVDDDKYTMQGMYRASVSGSMSVPTVPSVLGLHIGGGYTKQYVQPQSYPVQHLPTVTMPPEHRLSAAYSAPSSSHYTYTHGSTALPSNDEANHNLSNGSMSSTNDINGGQAASTYSGYRGLQAFNSSSAASNNTPNNAPINALNTLQTSGSFYLGAMSHSQNNVNSSAAVPPAPDLDGHMPRTDGTAASIPQMGHFILIDDL